MLELELVSSSKKTKIPSVWATVESGAVALYHHLELVSATTAQASLAAGTGDALIN